MGREEVTGGLGAVSSLGAVIGLGASCSKGLQANETLGVIGNDDVPNSALSNIVRSVSSSLSVGFENSGHARR